MPLSLHYLIVNQYVGLLLSEWADTGKFDRSDPLFYSISNDFCIYMQVEPDELEQPVSYLVQVACIPVPSDSKPSKALISGLCAVQMASDGSKPGSKSSVIFRVTNNFCVWRFSPSLLYEIEGWPTDQMVV